MDVVNPLSLTAWLPGLSLAVAGAVLIAALAMCGLLWRAGRSTCRLAQIAPQMPGPWPSVWLIVAARNEERHLAAAVQSLLALDYPALSILVVNDRSTDGTAAILDALAAQSSRLAVLTVEELPPGWLGKNHALQLGADRATGQWLLFTDADVLFEPSTLKRAMAHALAEGLDHLAVTPQPQMRGGLLNALVVAFSLYFTLWIRAWAIRRADRSAHVGIGAFNLVRTAAYRAVGGHRAIRLRPDDDLKLGQRLKACGFRQGLAHGTGLIGVEWYASVGEMARGLEKNAFAGMDYRPQAVLAASLAVLALHVWPFVAAALVGGPARWLYLAASLTLWGAAASAARGLGLSARHGLGFPVAAVLLVGIQWRSMLLNYYHGGIRWRETFYPLAELRRPTSD
jgi:hypothetical protein